MCNGMETQQVKEFLVRCILAVLQTLFCIAACGGKMHFWPQVIFFFLAIPQVAIGNISSVKSNSYNTIQIQGHFVY